MVKAHYVSVHGGHSGEFCNHAKDSLEEIIQAYISHGYSWVGITEHAPGIRQDLLYPDQQAAGLTPEFLLERFGRYMQQCRHLQQKYCEQITVLPAMEIETYSGYESFVPMLCERFRPDYIVGSVHFVDDLGFDYSPEQYQQTADAVGGIDAMYCRYFDLQYEMIELFKPAVVGHFDLIRIFDKNYLTRLEKPQIWQRIRRNLQRIKELGLILDFNLRALLKGAREPYVSTAILAEAKALDISVVPGDDSHGIANIHVNMDMAIKLLEDQGFSSRWHMPKRIDYSSNEWNR